MKRAIFVSLGTVAGVAAALNYTPVAGTTSTASIKGQGFGSLGGSTSGTNTSAPTPAASDSPAPAATTAAPTPGQTTAAPTPKATPSTKGSATPTPTPSASPTSAKPSPTKSSTPTKKPTAKPTPKPTKKPTPKPSPTKTGPVDGIYTGTTVRAGTYGGVQVQIQTKGGVVTGVTVLTAPNGDTKSATISQDCIPKLESEVMAAASGLKSSNVNSSISAITGATTTSIAFNASLQAALVKAGL